MEINICAFNPQNVLKFSRYNLNSYINMCNLYHFTGFSGVSVFVKRFASYSIVCAENTLLKTQKKPVEELI